MNVESTEPQIQLAATPMTACWSTRRWITLIGLALIAHVALVFLFSTRSDPKPRPVSKIPQFHLVDDNCELVALNDPSLFALPHLNDFLPAAWRRPVPFKPPKFDWSEPPQYLPPVIKNWGVTFKTFMQTNLFSGLNPDYKPEPPPAGSAENFGLLLRQNSTLQLAGRLAQRRMLNQIIVPTLVWNDVVKPSRVQLLVDANGSVASVVLLESSEYAAADQNALALAKTARFAPGEGSSLGEFIFNWHTVPARTP